MYARYLEFRTRLSGSCTPVSGIVIKNALVSH